MRFQDKHLQEREGEVVSVNTTSFQQLIELRLRTEDGQVHFHMVKKTPESMLSAQSLDRVISAARSLNESRRFLELQLEDARKSTTR